MAELKGTIKLKPIEHINNKLVEMLSERIVPWRNTGLKYGYAKNFDTGDTYSGINYLMLNYVYADRWTIPYFLGRGQIRKLGGKMKKGTTAYWIYTYKRWEKENSTDKDKKYNQVIAPRPVFNIDDVEGIEWETPEKKVYSTNPIDDLKDIISGNFIDVETDKSIESPVLIADNREILMPPIDSYGSELMYYKALVKESIHFTGIHYDRPGIKDDADVKDHLREQVIAELGTSFLMAALGVNLEDYLYNLESYCNMWINWLDVDPYCITYAVGKAEQASNFLLANKSAFQCRNKKAKKPNFMFFDE